MRLQLITSLAAALLLGSTQHVAAQAINPVLDDKFTFKLGVLRQELEGDIIVNRPPLPETPIDLGVLGVDDKPTNVWASARWRISDRWALNFLFNRFDETGGGFVTEEFNFDGDVYEVGVGLDTALRADAYIFNLSYSFVKTDKSDFGVGLGIHAFDLEAEIALSGEISGGGDPIGGSVSATSEDLIAPVPNLRLYGIYAFTPKTSLRGDFGWLSLTYGDYEGSFYYASAALEYRFTQAFGAGIGYQFTNVDVKYEDGEDTTEFDFEFNGAQLYLTYSF